jgi:putative transposase
MSERRACALVGADRTSMRYRSTKDDDAPVRERLRTLAGERRRFGYRRLHILLRREGITINRKKTQRIYREEGLTVRRRKGRRRAVGARAPVPVLALPNQRWSLDFVHDQLAGGRRFRVLNIVDDVTRECLAAVPDTSISGKRVVRELGELINRRGAPTTIVSDNGTELTSNAVLLWAGEAGIDWHYIAPGKPMQNGYVERLASPPFGSTGACATSCSTRRCSPAWRTPARRSRPGSTTTTPSDRTPRSATPPRRHAPPNSKSNGRG